MFTAVLALLVSLPPTRYDAPVAVQSPNAQPQVLSAERIEVGDLVMVTCDQDVPCDMVLVASSHPNARCYVTTANLDGESNLKVRCAHRGRNVFSTSLLRGWWVAKCS